ncbi:hypothetical protein [[Mycoplasma] gypis]|uniref:Uncharacterized protein n=1 Tax=[Mycoplasma] gypis TaxID=92404 RepID=A0ABZ2RQE7_9BACT|nr:hypothetical protein [[Mycoplasma] gypis]MBN0919545.1 hypothetical protein [[Mycoplasma] gypis]
MNNIYDKKWTLLKEFIDICKENNLWYSADGYTLLSAATNFDFTQNLEYFEVMMKYDSYEKLKFLFPTRVVDNTTISLYKDLQIKFVFNETNIFEDTNFIKINLIMPTTLKKVKKINSFSNIFRYKLQYFKTFKNTTLFSIKAKKFFAKMLSVFFKTITYKEVVNKTYEGHYEGFFVAKNLSKKLSNRWISNLSNHVVIFKWNDLEINALNEYSDYLKINFGNDLNKVKIPNSKYFYLNVIDIDKKEKDEK